MDTTISASDKLVSKIAPNIPEKVVHTFSDVNNILYINNCMRLNNSTIRDTPPTIETFRFVAITSLFNIWKSKTKSRSMSIVKIHIWARNR